MTTAFQDALKVIERQQDFLEEGDEEDVKEYVIKPLLLNIGWNIFDREELKKEYQLPNGEKVDYSLRLGSKSRVFVEAKRWKPTLSNDNRDQLHRYCLTAVKDKQMASVGDVPCLGILTNGRFWRFYVAPVKNNHKVRQMDPEIDIINPDKKRVEGYFNDFLARERLETDASVKKTLEKARKHHERFSESIAIRKRLTTAWNTLTKIPTWQENLLAEFASSHKIQADQALIEDFIKSTDNLFNPVTAKTPARNQLTQKPTSFTLNTIDVDKTIAVNSSADVMRKLCKLLYEHCPDTFSQSVLNIGQAWVSPTHDIKEGHEEIGDSGVAVSVHGAAKVLEDRSRKVVASLGYAKESLIIINRAEA